MRTIWNDVARQYQTCNVGSNGLGSPHFVCLSHMLSPLRSPSASLYTFLELQLLHWRGYSLPTCFSISDTTDYRTRHMP